MGLNFHGIDTAGYGGYTLTDQLLYNIKFFVDFNMLSNGAYGIFELNDASWYDTDESQLHITQDDRYLEGQVWEGAGREWVWESGVSIGSGALDPFRVSGVYIDTVFYPVTISGMYSHHIDYLNGRVIFDQPQSTSSNIQLEFTRRSVHIGFADDPDFRVMMLNAIEEFLTDSLPSGTPSREHQLWLPSVFIEVGGGSQRGLQLGGGQIKTRDIVFHIFADNPQDRNLLMDWLDFQSRTTFWMADLNKITFPFDQYGDIVPGITNWVNMVANNPWKKLRVIDSTPATINSLNSRLFRARVVWQAEVDVGNI